MKKLIILPLVFFSVFVSCRKEYVCHLPEPETVISSDWLSLQFKPEAKNIQGQTITCQVSNFLIMPVIRYDSERYVKLAFIKGSERGYFFYWPIPGSALIQNYSMDFELTQTDFSVTVWDALNQSQLPDKLIIEDSKYRYILIPKVIYGALAINWSDYHVVASTFNLTL